MLLLWLWLLLWRWQAGYDFANKRARVAEQDFFFGGIIHPGIGLLLAISTFASLERWALGGTQSALSLWLTLGALILVLRYQRRRREGGVTPDAPDFYPSEMARLDLTSAS